MSTPSLSAVTTSARVAHRYSESAPILREAASGAVAELLERSAMDGVMYLSLVPLVVDCGEYNLLQVMATIAGSPVVAAEQTPPINQRVLLSLSNGAVISGRYTGKEFMSDLRIVAGSLDPSVTVSGWVPI